MGNMKRRDFLKATAGVAAGAAAPMIWVPEAHAQWNSAPEKGAKLRVLRWSRFVQGDIDQYMKNVKKFEDKYQLNFPLLADTDHKVSERYGVWQEKEMAGRKYWGVARTTFIIAPDGTIAKVFESVQPENHGTEVADALAALKLRKSS